MLLSGLSKALDVIILTDILEISFISKLICPYCWSQYLMIKKNPPEPCLMSFHSNIQIRKICAISLTNLTVELLDISVSFQTICCLELLSPVQVFEFTNYPDEIALRCWLVIIILFSELM